MQCTVYTESLLWLDGLLVSKLGSDMMSTYELEQTCLERLVPSASVLAA